MTVISPMTNAFAPAVPCAHIAAWYQIAWERHRCIGNNLLRHGYRRWSEGSVKIADIEHWNNLYPAPGEAKE